MTEETLNIFERVAENDKSTADVLEDVVQHFRNNESPMELFEALKMRTRIQLGLPLISQENEARRPEDIERQLEQGLLEACRETGAMLIRLGRVGEG